MRKIPGNNAVRGGPVSLARSGGFSLFELVVFIILVAIIYSVAANRFAEFPAAAERANFLAVTTQIQSGVNLELLQGLISGNNQNIADYENSNPMEFLLNTPSNYLGAFDLVDTDRLSRRSWYFDRQRAELVYLVNYSTNVFLLFNGSQVASDEIRFRIELVYRGEGNRGSSSIEGEDTPEQIDGNGSKRLSGMVLRPVVPYLWEPSGVSLPEVAIADATG